jgi:hypothetical protein
MMPALVTRLPDKGGELLDPAVVALVSLFIHKQHEINVLATLFAADAEGVRTRLPLIPPVDADSEIVTSLKLVNVPQLDWELQPRPVRFVTLKVLRGWDLRAV